ncbi:MAG: hypothetical protein KDB14_23315 [Planctomycetales bacterium]|nr:hypothetical protein [Planctomycetales bacterium]
MKRREDARPWGTLLGLMASCLATLAGVAAGVDPDVVLLRALQAGLAAATIWTVARLVFLTVLEASTKR